MEARSDAPITASVLIPVYNEEEHIRETARAMLAQDLDAPVEFLFVDGRSSDRTRQVLDELGREDSRVRVLDNPARRTTNALNIGLRNARGEFVARMDAHASYPPNYLSSGIERLRRGDVDWVIGPALPQATGRWSYAVKLALGSWIGAGGSRKWSDQGEIAVDTGVFAGVWRRSTLEAYGGWDERWPVNQDSELAARVLAAGGKIVCLGQMAAGYVPRDDLRGLATQYWRYGFFREKTSRHHPDSMRRSHLLAPALVLAVLTSLLGPRRLRAAGRGTLAAYLLILLVASMRITRGSRGDPLSVATVLATMHGSWGVGFLAGCLKFGPPTKAIGRATGILGRSQGATADRSHR